MYAQLIDDLSGTTLVAASTRDTDATTGSTGNTDAARLVGVKLAERAKSKGIETCVFDRSGFRYHGRVRALADAAREGGLKF
jgi:large subunit ribosomal protein L18